ncbi:FHA domain-containing protein, partial [Microbacterium testaceum]|uniref:FHA domain-containing protein n=1 Tax=Microbacterium testaceum TaxID=2033 RepID=UPI000B092735
PGPDAPPPTARFHLLDSPRAHPNRPRPARRTPHAAPAPADPDDNGFQPTVPLTPGLPFRGRGAAAAPHAPAEPEVEPAPRAAQTFPQPEPWAPPRRAEVVDTPVSDSPLTRPAPEASPESEAPASDAEATPDEFPELSEAVSAVSGAPDAGAPRSARTSVAALYTQPEFAADPDGDDDLDALDRTVVARRRRIPWALVPPSGDPIDLTSSVVIVGRRPAADTAFPDAQLVAIADETRTVSKTHARLQLRGETWFVTDLDSTNGVLFATLMGTEIEAPPGEEIEAGERFFLGDAEVRLSRRDA